MLTQQQIEAYHRDGYVAVESVVSPDDIAELRRVTDEFVEKSRSVTEHTDVFDLEPGHTAETPRLRRLKSPSKQHPIYDRLLRYDAILDIVEQLIGNGVRTNGEKLNLKSPEFGSPVEWHQDWAFYPNTNDDLLAVGVALDDMTLENGCLMVIPGSHRGKVYSHHQRGAFIGAVTEKDFDPSGAVPVVVKAGGITIHHCRMLHGSAPNVSDKPRRLLLYQYCAIDAFPIQGIPDWNTFNSFILRGQPTFEPRMTACPVRIPLPAGERAGSIYEYQTMLDEPIFGKKVAR